MKLRETRKKLFQFFYMLEYPRFQTGSGVFVNDFILGGFVNNTLDFMVAFQCRCLRFGPMEIFQGSLEQGFFGFIPLVPAFCLAGSF